MLFDRKKYKIFAKKQLHKRWKIPVLVTIISGLVMTLFSIPEMILTLRSPSFHELLEIDFSDFESLSFLLNQLSYESTSDVISIIQIAVKAILTVAGICVYLKMSRSPEKVFLSDFFDGMNNWWRAILAALWQFLWIFLWSLLFIIPGIIKAISYSQTFYLIAEHKNLSVTKALRISKLLTHGHKFDIFVMHLSFLGWMILATIPAGLGFIFLEPYLNLSFINAYHAMLKDALESGKIKPEDLE